MFWFDCGNYVPGEVLLIGELPDVALPGKGLPACPGEVPDGELLDPM